MNILVKAACLSFFFLWQISVSAQIKWYNPVSDSLLPVQGRYWNKEIGNTYHRIPQRAKEKIRKSVWNLSRQSAGLYVKFYTNAPTVNVKYLVSGAHSMYHMPFTGVSGIDLYTTDCNGKQFWCSGNYQIGDTIKCNYKITYHNTHRKGNEFTLYLPLYNEVKFLQIGIPEDNYLEFVRPSTEKPIVIYGTSIAQGACASRPGMAWTNILQRKLDTPVINLGFSGNGLLDEEFFRLLSEIDASLFVIDCMPNMTGDNVKWIQSRTEKGLRLLRNKSNAPILLVEHDGYMGYHSCDMKKEEFMATNRELRKVYDKMKDEIGNLHYLTFEELNLSMDSQVDGTHATDIGMMEYANAYYRKITSLLYPELEDLSFTPCRQHRDLSTYNWMKRHEEILDYNAKKQPQYVMIGNSITHYWGGEPYEKRRVANDVWNKLFKGKTVVNLGYGWDRIENIEWRIIHGELDGFKAEKIFMMIGTNNLDLNTDEEIVRGIKDVVKLVKNKQSAAELYVVKILPRRNKEDRLVELNDKIEAALLGESKVKVIDISEPLLNKDGKINEKLFSDGLHPNHKGYAIIANKLGNIISE